MERKGIFEFLGQGVTILGPDLQTGQPAPEFSAVAKDWSIVHTLESTQGKVRIIGSLPSLNSSVCDRETRRFNQEAAALGQEIALLMVSRDLPFTLKTWCAAAGIDQVVTLSDYLFDEFGERYGVLIKEYRIFRRAIFVVDRAGSLVYVEYMPRLGDEPNYAAVLDAARSAAGMILEG